MGVAVVLVRLFDCRFTVAADADMVLSSTTPRASTTIPLKRNFIR